MQRRGQVLARGQQSYSTWHEGFLIFPSESLEKLSPGSRHLGQSAAAHPPASRHLLFFHGKPCHTAHVAGHVLLGPHWPQYHPHLGALSSSITEWEGTQTLGQATRKGGCGHQTEGGGGSGVPSPKSAVCLSVSL